jgi:hypothetical protein
MSTVRELFGLACPKCGSDEPLCVVIKSLATLSPDGTDPFGDHEWDEESPCLCKECDFTGLITQFTLQEVVS